jgi:hypothetical protein
VCFLVLLCLLKLLPELAGLLLGNRQGALGLLCVSRPCCFLLLQLTLQAISLAP